MTPIRLLEHLRSIASHPLSRGSELAAIGRFVKWQIGSRLLAAPVLVPFTDHAHLLIRTGMTGATCNIYTGLHDFPEMSFTAHLLRDDDYFADVGANVGTYTIIAGKIAGAECIAFEPSPITFGDLQNNTLVNRISVDLRNEAVGATAGTASFVVSKLDTTSHIAREGEEGRKIEITTLDASLGRTPTLMKIDVEGFESSVLDGGDRVFKDKTLIAVIMETNGEGEQYGGGNGEISKRMEKLNFKPYSYSPFTRGLIPALREKNTIFIRDVDSVVRRLQTAKSFFVRNIKI